MQTDVYGPNDYAIYVNFNFYLDNLDILFSQSHFESINFNIQIADPNFKICVFRVLLLI